MKKKKKKDGMETDTNVPEHREEKKKTRILGLELKKKKRETERGAEPENADGSSLPQLHQETGAPLPLRMRSHERRSDSQPEDRFFY